MNSSDLNARGPDTSDRAIRGDKFTKEQELLARVRELAQLIVARVNKVLEDTNTHVALPTEENPPLQ